MIANEIISLVGKKNKYLLTHPCSTISKEY